MGCWVCVDLRATQSTARLQERSTLISQHTPFTHSALMYNAPRTSTHLQCPTHSLTYTAVCKHAAISCNIMQKDALPQSPAVWRHRPATSNASQEQVAYMPAYCTCQLATACASLFHCQTHLQPYGTARHSNNMMRKPRRRGTPSVLPTQTIIASHTSTGAPSALAF